MIRLGLCILVLGATVGFLSCGGSLSGGAGGHGGESSQGGGRGGAAGFRCGVDVSCDGSFAPVGGTGGNPSGGAGGASGRGGAGGGQLDGGRDSVADGAEAGTTTPATCHEGLTCSTGESCTLDCKGRSGQQVGSGGFPYISCSCSGGGYNCFVLYEGTLGSSPVTCTAGTVEGGACPNACGICQTNPDAAGNRVCFCTKDLVWLCG